MLNSNDVLIRKIEGCLIATEGPILNERALVKILAKKLRKRNEQVGLNSDQYLGKVFAHANPAKAPKVCSFLKELYGGLAPRLQPEIDLIFKNGDNIRAVEVKCFRLRTSNSLSGSYYEGIDQALALLMYGFNNVALWHVFDQTINPKQFMTSGSTAQLFIREQLKLPIDFTALVLVSREDYFFIPTQPRVTDFETMELVDVKLLKTIDDPTFPWVWQTSNPISKYPRCFEAVSEARRTLSLPSPAYIQNSFLDVSLPKPVLSLLPL